MSKNINPSLPLEGGCQCGEVRYRINQLPLTLYACHCTECQKQSSSGFGMSMPVLRETVEFFGNELKLWKREAVSGNTLRCHFCPTCGTRLFHESSAAAPMVNIKAGTLDDSKWLSPIASLWISSAQSGTIFAPDSIQYDTQPSDFTPLREAWIAKYETDDA